MERELLPPGYIEHTRDRKDRMRRFWAHPVNATIHPIGKLLAAPLDDGRAAAAHLVDGGADLGDAIEYVDGPRLPIAEPMQTIDWSNFDDFDGGRQFNWACPACNSAHGSGKPPSNGERDAQKLAENHWFYAPADQRLFVISKHCYRKYVRDLGMEDRFRPLPPADE